MSTQLPPFTEPDWSTLPKEAVAWAVDASGLAYWHTEIPEPYGCIWPKREPLAPIAKFDPTTFDWRTTLRLRPTEPAKVEPEPAPLYEMHREQARYVNDQANQKELERLAEEAWKALLANPDWSQHSAEVISSKAFDAASAFITEREKRRNK